MKNRTVARQLFAETIDMDGMPVRQPFPTQLVDQVDPFLLLHHHLANMPEHVVPHKTGVAPHPHRGFSPVTFVYRGGVHHRDSRGNNSVVYEGGTQWMNAGRGIVHSERPPKDILERGGVQEIVQLWVNTPAAHKMDQPEYFPLTAADTPTVTAEGVGIQVVAGALEQVRGPIKAKSPLLVLRLEMKAGASYTFPIPQTYNAFLYLLDGAVQVAGYGLVEGLHQVIFNQDGDSVQLTAKADTRALLLAGEPLNEPVAKHGPFVMNNQTELMQAMRDYRMGKFGILIED
ncbi:pirin family protein [Pontibacter mangrovi]|uniref:Pirin family protein n=1 Tax=Pontibacter mangrovi TaxID=2589816 RepID=A0A501WE78_9BACT|nr:pirin family protein [Pontibacter mangrovi]TPE46384.1 pirin family protein [Pontibacter mangrovi]